jgi:hypothetical protein
MDKEEKEVSLDILKHIEDLSNKVNGLMAEKASPVFKRYPVTFGIMILIGAIALHEGLKGLLYQFGFLDINPWYLVAFGVLLLTITGKLYQKLDK